jgi:hypothetical protein
MRSHSSSLYSHQVFLVHSHVQGEQLGTVANRGSRGVSFSFNLKFSLSEGVSRVKSGDDIAFFSS